MTLEVGGIVVSTSHTPQHTHTFHMGKLRLGRVSNQSQVALQVKTPARSHPTRLHCNMEP